MTSAMLCNTKSYVACHWFELYSFITALTLQKGLMHSLIKQWTTKGKLVLMWHGLVFHYFVLKDKSISLPYTKGLPYFNNFKSSIYRMIRFTLNRKLADRNGYLRMKNSFDIFVNFTLCPFQLVKTPTLNMVKANQNTSLLIPKYFITHSFVTM